MKKLILTLIACFALVLVPVVALFGCSKKKSDSNKLPEGEGKVAVTFFVDRDTKTVSVIDKNTTVKKPTSPRMKNYKFDGWYANEEKTEYFNFKTPVTESITLYARFYDGKLTMGEDENHAYVSACNSMATSVTIPELYHGKPTTEISSNAFNSHSNFTEFVVPDFITSIGWYAFSSCTGLKSITIGSGVTSIGDGAFRGCTSIETFEMLGSADSIGGLPTDNLTTFVWNGSTVPSRAFYGAELLTSVTLGDSVQSIGYEAFQDCTGLKSITIGSGVTSIGTCAFYGCTAVERFEMLGSADSIGGLPTDNLTTFVWNGSTVPSRAFYGAELLTSVTLGDKVKELSYGAFSCCSSLKEINIPNNVEIIGPFAFESCIELETITIGNSVKEIGESAFSECISLTEIVIPGTVRHIADSLFNECSNLGSVTFENGVESIGRWPFAGCDNLVNVTLPESIIAVTQSSFGLWGDNLSFNERLGAKYLGCEANPYVLLYSTTDKSITNADGILNDVKIIGVNAFNDCKSLATVSIPNSVNVICEYVFNNCNSIVFNERFGAKYLGNTENPYLYLHSVEDKTISDISNILSDVRFIGSSAFSNCTYITTAVIPSSVFVIENSAFSGCEQLHDVTIGDSMRNIGVAAFYECVNLEKITIGQSVLMFGGATFHECSALQTIVIKSPEIYVKAEESDSDLFRNQNIVVYVLSDIVNEFNSNYLERWFDREEVSDGEFAGYYMYSKR